MDPTNCLACGKPLKPGAVLCIECGFDLRTGRTLRTEVVPSAARRERPGDGERFACEKFHLCQLEGLGRKILVCDDEDVLAYIRSPARPFWTCFTVLVAVPLVVLVPVGLSWLFVVTAQWAGIPLPGTTLAVLLVTLAVAVGIVVALCTGNLMRPRRRLKVWDDESRGQLLMEVVETRKFGTARISITGADGQPAGRILHQRRRRRYVLLDRFDQPLAALLAAKVEYTTEREEREPGELATGCLLGLLFGRLWLVLPRTRTERAYSEWFMHRMSSLAEDPAEKIGRVTFNPVREYPYRIELPGDPERTVDRALVVALAGLLPW